MLLEGGLLLILICLRGESQAVWKGAGNETVLINIGYGMDGSSICITAESSTGQRAREKLDTRITRRGRRLSIKPRRRRRHDVS